MLRVNIISLLQITSSHALCKLLESSLCITTFFFFSTVIHLKDISSSKQLHTIKISFQVRDGLVIFSKRPRDLSTCAFCIREVTHQTPQHKLCIRPKVEHMVPTDAYEALCKRL